MPTTPTPNTLYYGDNLPILREHIATASVDLVYLDPPFQSGRSYNVLFKNERGQESEAQITAFTDTWHWNEAVERAYNELVMEGPPQVGKMLGALLGLVNRGPMMAYLVMMTARLVELRRVLKLTGSIYLHCDETASHYLKIVLDTIFGPASFRNEIIWQRTSAHNDPKRYGRNYDCILYYARESAPTWHPQNSPYSQKYIASHYQQQDDRGFYTTRDLTAPDHGTPSAGLRYSWKGVMPPSGRTWSCVQTKMAEYDQAGLISYSKEGMPRLKRYLEEMPGVSLQALWTDIPPINSQAAERLGYPTQKPLALLERIIAASSNPGDVVLDPFAGCGTAVAAAQKLGRRWLGIDITHLSIALLKYRLRDMFGETLQYQVIGEPEDLDAARQLATEDRYQFQWWALSLVQAKPLGGQEGSKTGKKGSDRGIDGVITFIDDTSGKPQQVLVQVKSGHVKSGDIRDLVGTLEREKAAIGVFVTLEEPSGPMRTEAASAGVYSSPGWNQRYPRCQVLTIAELLRGATIAMPPPYGTFKAAPRVHTPTAQQGAFPLEGSE